MNFKIILLATTITCPLLSMNNGSDQSDASSKPSALSVKMAGFKAKNTSGKMIKNIIRLIMEEESLVTHSDLSKRLGIDEDSAKQYMDIIKSSKALTSQNIKRSAKVSFGEKIIDLVKASKSSAFSTNSDFTEFAKTLLKKKDRKIHDSIWSDTKEQTDLGSI